MRRRPKMAVVALAPWLALSLAPSPAHATDKVLVTNRTSRPVPVTATVNEPVQAISEASLSGPTNVVIYVVPAHRRLVVEHFSSELGVASTTSVNRYSLGVASDPSMPGGVRFSHFIAPAFSSPCGTCVAGQVEVVASQPIRMYVEAGEALVVNVTFSGPVGPDSFGFFSVSGYMIDTP